MEKYSYSLQGRRESNEDQHICLLNLNNNSEITSNNCSINFFGVFDGHGGKGVSKYLKDNILNYFAAPIHNKLYNSKDKLIIQYFIDAFNHLNKKLQKTHPRIAFNSGSTACIGIMTKDDILWILNVGDSRAVKCNYNNKAEQLSEDHKPNSPTEKKRIENLGGRLEYDGVDWRIKDYSVSRAFGDLNASPYITHIPQIYKYKLKNEKFIIFACDGLWDIMSNQNAVDFINSLVTSGNNINYAKALAEHAFKNGSLDNITVMIYFF
jgi:serine/threonine protein phosphatase PrpC